MRKVKGLITLLLALKPEDHGKSMVLKIAAGLAPIFHALSMPNGLHLKSIPAWHAHR